jgi:hypothetical protein
MDKGRVEERSFDVVVSIFHLQVDVGEQLGQLEPHDPDCLREHDRESVFKHNFLIDSLVVPLLFSQLRLCMNQLHQQVCCQPVS